MSVMSARGAATDEGLKHLDGISSLKNLEIGNTRMTEGGVKEFHARNSYCEIASDFGLIGPDWSAAKPPAKPTAKPSSK